MIRHKWDVDDLPEIVGPRGLGGWIRFVVRGVALCGLVFGGLAVLLLMRLVERPLFGHARPWTPKLVMFVCRNALRVLGLPLRVEGELSPAVGAIVVNHASWLDIFVLNAVKRVYFVSKAEVASWFAIGPLARATGTIFIERRQSRALHHRDLLSERLALGDRLLFFPEGTSTDGRRVLDFKPTLFEALIAVGDPDLLVQPATILYRAPPAADPRFYGWWRDMTFSDHLRAILSVPRQGDVTICYHPPLRVGDSADRKALALAAQKPIAERMKQRLVDGR